MHTFCYDKGSDSLIEARISLREIKKREKMEETQKDKKEIDFIYSSSHKLTGRVLI